MEITTGVFKGLTGCEMNSTLQISSPVPTAAPVQQHRMLQPAELAAPPSQPLCPRLCHVPARVTAQAWLLRPWPSPGGASPVTMYWESPEKAQSHIQPRDVSPGLLLLMLSSVIRQKFEVLQILHV